MEFPQIIQQRAYKRSLGKCECSRTTHHHSGRCNTSLGNHWFIHPKTSLRSRDDVTLSNSEVVCTACHKAMELLAVI